jgi:hypothetical protein
VDRTEWTKPNQTRPSQTGKKRAMGDLAKSEISNKAHNIASLEIDVGLVSALP